MTNSAVLAAKLLCVTFLVFATVSNGQESDESMELMEVRKIWDRAPHNAFTDLIRFRNRFYCTFREADAHVGGDGGRARRCRGCVGHLEKPRHIGNASRRPGVRPTGGGDHMIFGRKRSDVSPDDALPGRSEAVHSTSTNKPPVLFGGSATPYLNRT